MSHTPLGPAQERTAAGRQAGGLCPSSRAEWLRGLVQTRPNLPACTDAEGALRRPHNSPFRQTQPTSGVRTTSRSQLLRYREGAEFWSRDTVPAATGADLRDCETSDNLRSHEIAPRPRPRLNSVLTGRWSPVINVPAGWGDLREPLVVIRHWSRESPSLGAQKHILARRDLRLWASQNDILAWRHPVVAR